MSKSKLTKRLKVAMDAPFSLANMQEAYRRGFTEIELYNPNDFVGEFWDSEGYKTPFFYRWLNMMGTPVKKVGSDTTFWMRFVIPTRGKTGQMLKVLAAVANYAEAERLPHAKALKKWVNRDYYPDNVTIVLIRGEEGKR